MFNKEIPLHEQQQENVKDTDFLYSIVIREIIEMLHVTVVFRAVARALIGRGVYIHIFVLCPTNFF